MKPERRRYLLIALAVGSCHAFVATNSLSTSPRPMSAGLMALPSPEQGGSSLSSESDRMKKQSLSELSAVALGSYLRTTNTEASLVAQWQETIQPVLSASLLVTASTIGATCLVLPETVQGPGIGISSTLFVGAFVMNLLSGLLIAEVAIKQHEATGSQVPSSFKEFAEENLQSKVAANSISFISMFVNCCVASFDVTRAGAVGSPLLGLDASTTSMVFASVVAGLAATCSMATLSDIASAAVTVLCTSFAFLLLPGLTHVQDPIGTWMASGVDSDLNAAVLHSAPIILLTMVYQNIVPTVTRNLDYDRVKTATALFMGSALPLFIYMAWCFAVLGGGIDTTSLLGGPLMMVFSASAVFGSGLSCTMSIAQEMDTFLKTDAEKKNTFSIPSVTLAMGIPLAAGLALSKGGDFSSALSAAGAYGDPLLYGAIPVIMSWIQRRNIPSIGNVVPGGTASLCLLGLGSIAFLWEELSKDFGVLL